MKFETSPIAAVNPLARELKTNAARPSKKTSSTAKSAESEASAISQISTSEVDLEPAFDALRVEDIKQAIAEGRFSINPEAIASRLIDSAKELITQGRSSS